MRVIDGDYYTQGYLIVSLEQSGALIRSLYTKFETRFLARFSSDSLRNRAVIKLLAEDLNVKRFFCNTEIEMALKNLLGIAEPVQTGPVVTHYTSGNSTGKDYGLPYHQDWPSMGTSSKGVIAWTSITDIGTTGPGLRIVPGSHLQGLWPGNQTDNGYVLTQQDISNFLDIEIEAGQVLFMSPFLVHRQGLRKCQAGTTGNYPFPAVLTTSIVMNGVAVIM